MKVGSRRAFIAAATAAVTCILIEIGAAAQAPPQAAADKVPLSDEVFKSIQLLKGIPVDTFFESMGMFASAMGNDCTFCHVKEAYYDKTQFAQVTPKMQRARQMITMMNELNEKYFAGRTRVTCFTCHGGSNAPKSEPDLALQYGEAVEDPNARDFPVDTRVTGEQVLDKYVQVLGGADRLARFTSFTARGMYWGFDTAQEKVPFELFAKAPNQQTMIVHLATGNSTRTFDGRNGWYAGPDQPVPLLTLTEGNLDRARLEAIVAFPAGLKTAFPRWRTGRTAIDGKEVRIVQGVGAAQALANFYFDEAGLLVRMVRWTRTPVGFIPTQVDYSDYRDVAGAGVKMPFKRTVSQTYMQMTVELSDVQPNATIQANRFAQPAPVNPVTK
jgi:Photosynthetic reaction centre cytochrome C subunit